MLFARDCEIEVLEDLLVYVLPSPFVAVANRPHPLQVDDSGEPVLQFRNALLKRAKDPRGLVQRFPLLLVVVHHARHLLHARQRRQVGDDERIHALEVRPLRLELGPPLVVDQPAHRVREMRTLRRRVCRRLVPYRVNVRHPAVAELCQRLVQPLAPYVALVIGR